MVDTFKENKGYMELLFSVDNNTIWMELNLLEGQYIDERIKITIPDVESVSNLNNTDAPASTEFIIPQNQYPVIFGIVSELYQIEVKGKNE